MDGLLCFDSVCLKQEHANERCDELCKKTGDCVAKQGKCLVPAATNGECNREHGSRQVNPCATRGWCTAIDGVCRASSNEACTRSEVCEKTGACIARNGVCVMAAKTDADCIRGHGSLGWNHCQSSGACTANDGTCVATKDEDCKRSELCKESGKCTASNGKCALGVH